MPPPIKRSALLHGLEAEAGFDNVFSTWFTDFVEIVCGINFAQLKKRKLEVGIHKVGKLEVELENPFRQT